MPPILQTYRHIVKHLLIFSPQQAAYILRTPLPFVHPHEPQFPAASHVIATSAARQSPRVVIPAKARIQAFSPEVQRPPRFSAVWLLALRASVVNDAPPPAY